MPRKKLIRTSDYAYHITTRSNNREWFYIPPSEVWIFCKELLFIGEQKFQIKVDAFVLMNNHYHLCLYTPLANIDKFMHFFNQALGKKIARAADRINRIFGAPYKWSLIKTEGYYFNVLRYIYQNPLRAQIVDRCEEYPFSDILEQCWSKEEMDWFNFKVSEYEDDRTKKRLRKYVI